MKIKPSPTTTDAVPWSRHSADRHGISRFFYCSCVRAGTGIFSRATWPTRQAERGGSTPAVASAVYTHSSRPKSPFRASCLDFQWLKSGDSLEKVCFKTVSLDLMAHHTSRYVQKKNWRPSLIIYEVMNSLVLLSGLPWRGWGKTTWTLNRYFFLGYKVEVIPLKCVVLNFKKIKYLIIKVIILYWFENNFKMDRFKFLSYSADRAEL